MSQRDKELGERCLNLLAGNPVDDVAANGSSVHLKAKTRELANQPLRVPQTENAERGVIFR